jgi:ribulose-bisphosphate carboxylase large chain
MRVSKSASSNEMQMYTWEDGLDPADYVDAVFDVDTPIDPDEAAISIAREQSTTTDRVPGGSGYDLSPWRARVKSVEVLDEDVPPTVPGFWLDTLSYTHASERQGACSRALVRIAFPVRACGASSTNMWNLVGCEVHRMGFLSGIRLVDIELPEGLLETYQGPLHGIDGIRAGLGVDDRPLLCRPALPVGIDTAEMVRMNEQVLLGGFDIVKDDEITFDNETSPFRERVRAMVEMKHRVEDVTGERKYYVANVIDGPVKALELADVAVEEGADGLLVAPAIQGLEIASMLGRRTGAFTFAHPAWLDVGVRHPRFGVSPGLACKLQRLSGADLVSLPGDFATPSANPDDSRACISGCTDPLGVVRSSLPVMFGGKRPEGFPTYLEAARGIDFMIIATNAVDSHPGGMVEGARAFRDAWEDFAGLDRVEAASEVS